jgi:hypothetical protein
VYVIGIDPGLTSGALVAWDGQSVLAAKTYTWTAKTKREILGKREHDIGDMPFTDAILLARAQAQRMVENLESVIYEQGSRPIAIGIESFVDQRHRAREEKGYLIKERWKTPLLIGALNERLEDLGYHTSDGTILWQNAGVVLKQKGDVIRALANMNETSNFLQPLIRNYSTLTNDHLRKAWAHADWAWMRANKEKVC